MTRNPKTLRGFRPRLAKLNRALMAVGDLPRTTPTERLAYLHARRDALAAFVELYADARTVVDAQSVEWDALYDARDYRMGQLREVECCIADAASDGTAPAESAGGA